MTRAQFGTICGLLVLIALCQIIPYLQPARFSATYEYRIEDVHDLHFEDKMTRMGDAGWDLVFARRAIGGEADKEPAYEMIFKRPK